MEYNVLEISNAVMINSLDSLIEQEKWKLEIDKKTGLLAKKSKTININQSTKQNANIVTQNTPLRSYLPKLNQSCNRVDEIDRLANLFTNSPSYFTKNNNDNSFDVESNQMLLKEKTAEQTHNVFDNYKNISANAEDSENLVSPNIEVRRNVRFGEYSPLNPANQVNSQPYLGIGEYENKIQTRSVIVPITTRGIGFINRFLMQRLARLNIQNINIHDLSAALYRVSLCMLDIKLMQVLQSQVSRNLGTGYQHSFVPIDYVRAVGSLGTGFSPILNLISSVGILRAYGTTFVPRLPDPIFQQGFPQWDPTLVSFSNLREYVVALSDQLTPHDVRLRFYELNPIPCAIWNRPAQAGVRDHAGALIQDAFPVLQNPEHIMPANYNLPEIRNDVDTIMTALEMIGRKYPKYVQTGRIEYDGPGLATQLVSNDAAGLRCSDVAAIPNYTIPPVAGNIQLFWSNEVMSDPEFYMGSLHLIGEIPSFPDSRWAIRSFTASKVSADTDYISTLTNMIG